MNFFELIMVLRKRVKYGNISNRAKDNVKKQIYFNFLFFFDLFLYTYGLEINYIELKQFDGTIMTNYEEEQINIMTKKQKYKGFKNKFKINERENANHIDMHDVEVFQTAKDKANLSDAAYNAMRVVINKRHKFRMTSLNKLNIFKKKLNQFYKIEKNSLGCYIDAYEKLKFTIKKIYQQIIQKGRYIENNTFRIHLSGDGCGITRTKFNIISFTFKVLNYGVESTDGIFKLGKFLSLFLT